MGFGTKHALIVMTVFALACCRSVPQGSDAVSGASVSGVSGTVTASSLDPVQTGKKILVAYFSQGANTTRVAEELAGLLGADAERIVEKTNRSGFLGFLTAGADSSMGKLGNIEAPSHDPSAYDLVIVCTPVWAWHVSPPAHAYLALTKERLPSVAFVVVSAATEPREIVKSMEEISGKAAVASVGFVDGDFSAKNRVRYEAKIADFLTQLRRSGALPQMESAHEGALPGSAPDSIDVRTHAALRPDVLQPPPRGWPRSPFSTPAPLPLPVLPQGIARATSAR
jgi:hypothetical protein